MKLFTLVCMASLLGTTPSMAFTAKVKAPKLVTGTSIGKYAKPGAPVDIRYTTEHVSVGDTSIVSLKLTSTASSGSMQVAINIDKSLETVGNVPLRRSFNLEGVGKVYPLDFSVVGSSDGVFYIKLFVEMKGKGFRVFVIPVHVGNAKVKKARKALQKNAQGENISVSKAVETIKR